MMKEKILITGAGGPSAVCLYKSLQNEYELFMGDMDSYGAGFYLVDEKYRCLLQAANSPDFVDHLLEVCEEKQINVLIPTVDVELLKISKRVKEFEDLGVKVLIESAETLKMCLDKKVLLHFSKSYVPVPQSVTMQEARLKGASIFPLLAKPRRGSGSQGICKIETREDLVQLMGKKNMLLQEYLPGDEFSVDVVFHPTQKIYFAVPRTRLKVDSGIAVTSMTCRNSELETLAIRLCEKLNVRYAVNVQFKKDQNGVPKLLEVNPRFPGTMSLTIQSGVDMPRIAVASVLKSDNVPFVVGYKEIAMTRHWNEVYCSIDEIERLKDSKKRTNFESKNKIKKEGGLVDQSLLI